MSLKVLVVLPVLPWPPRRDGMSVRFLPVLQYLSRHFSVDLVVVDDTSESDARRHLTFLNSITVLHSREYRLPAIARRLITLLRGVAPFGAPLGQIDYRDRRQVKGELRTRIATHHYSAILISSAPWLMARDMDYPSECRVVYDFVDSPTLHMRRGGWLKGLERYFRRYTEWKCARRERRIRRLATATIYVSSPDADAVGRVTKAPAPLVIPNGVMEGPGDDVRPPPNVRPVVGFLGNMGYVPNINAAKRLAVAVMPRIRAAVPDAQLLVIGRSPSPEICALSGPSVTITGTVDDIWPHVQRVRVFVLPMLGGAGLQNKIIEAMYAGVPVVTTSVSAESLGADAGTQLLVADSDEGLARHAVELLRDQDLWTRVSVAGRLFVRERHSWERVTEQYAIALLGDEIEVTLS